MEKRGKTGGWTVRILRGLYNTEATVHQMSGQVSSAREQGAVAITPEEAGCQPTAMLEVQGEKQQQQVGG